MGVTQNELSQFGELEWIKCGEIKICANQNDFQLICIHCSSIFSQMAVFARHLHWEHQLGVELQGKQQGQNDLSIYTVEELLTNKKIDSNENICNTISDEDDTGLGSDEELEKEIEELLTSMAAADSSSSNETEYSENDSGFGHTQNIGEISKNTQDKDIHIHNIHHRRDIERKASKDLNTSETQKMSKKITIMRKDCNSLSKGNALKDNKNKSLGVPNIASTKILRNTTSNIGNKVNYTKTKPKETTTKKINTNNTKEKNCTERGEKESGEAPKIKKKLPLKQYLESKKFFLQSDDESKNSGSWIKSNTDSQNRDTISNVLVLKKENNKTQNNQNKEDNVLHIESKKCAQTSSSEKIMNAQNSEHMHIKKDCGNILPLTKDVLLSDKSGEEETHFGKTEKEKSLFKTNVIEMQISDGNLVAIQYEVPAIQDLSGYQREYISYNKTNDNSSSVEEETSHQLKCTTNEMEIEKPLDLSFNKSDEWSDVQLEEISEILATNGKVATQLGAEDLNELLVQQPPDFTNNTTSLFNSDQIQISDIIVDNLLPPFNKFFKNNVNSLQNSNIIMAQSTPKEKKMKTLDAKGMAVKNRNSNEYISNATAQDISENVEDVIPTQKISKSSENLQHQLKVLKRVSQCDEKENKSKKQRHEVEIVEEILKGNGCAKKTDIEILSVDIILPKDDKILSESTTFTNNNTVSPTEGISKTKDCNDSQIPSAREEETRNVNWGASTSESIIEDLIPYVKIKKPTILAADLSSHAAADSTSEQRQPLAYISEIDYTPDDTLNQLKLHAMSDEKLCFNSTMESFLNVPLSCDSQNNAADDSMISPASEEEQENYTLLRAVGLKIVMDPNAENELNLEQLEEMRAKAATFANIFTEFKYLWKFGKGIKSYEQLELDFNKLTHRLNGHYKFELTISQTKRIVNLISLWYKQTYHKWFIEKKRIINPVQHYLNTFSYLPKTARRIFYCEECPRYFLSQQKYLAHRLGHNVLMPTCANCQASFASRKELQLHAKVCATFKCVECAFKFENAANLEYHVRSNHMFQCEKCGKLCATAADLDWHEHQYPIICGLCNRLFDTAALLRKHRQDSFHWDYTCRTCEIFLPTATQMKQHLRLCMANAI